MLHIVQTRSDLDSLHADQKKQFVQYLKGTTTNRRNEAEYPEDYDNQLQEGDEGYIAPAWVDVTDLSTIQRFGFETVESLDEYAKSL